LAANCVSLTLNTKFDSNDPNFAPVPTVQLKDLIYGSGPLSGLTVGQILDEGNKKLGGCASIYTTSQLNQAMANIDSAYKGGFIGGLASLLTCPAAPPKMQAQAINDLSNVSVYPNPTTGILNLKFNTEVDGKVSLQLFDLAGRIVWNTEENAFAGDNFRTYDFSNVSKGIYLLNIVVNNQSQQIRVAVN